jgi:Phage integrase family
MRAYRRGMSAAARDVPVATHQAVTARTLRHTAAMRLLQAGVDATVIALWLGHEQVAAMSDLPARRYDPQGAGHRSNPAARHQAGSVPAQRRAAGVPRSPLITRPDSGLRIGRGHPHRHNPAVGIIDVQDRRQVAALDGTHSTSWHKPTGRAARRVTSCAWPFAGSPSNLVADFQENPAAVAFFV